MNETKELRLKIYKYTFLLTCLVSAVSAFIVNDYVGFILGLIFGTAIAALNFTLLAKTVEKSVYLPPEQANNYVKSRYFIRFTIYGVVLYISAIQDHINIIGTIVGILTIKIVIYIMHLFNDKTYYKNIFFKKDH